MANKRITDVDFLESLDSDESFFVNQNNTIKQINRGNITFGITNGGTGATDAATARDNLGITPDNIGAVNKSGDTMTGKLIVPSPMAVASENYPSYAVKKTADTEEEMGALTYDAETNRRFYFQQYAADMDGATTRYKENFQLPSPDSGRTAHGWYNILTSKNPVYITQGGTGATTAEDALKNLFAGGNAILSSNQYGDSLPEAGTAGRIFFKKV